MSFNKYMDSKCSKLVRYYVLDIKDKKEVVIFLKSLKDHQER